MRIPSYQWREISLAESYKLRALAILMILAHNFLHLIIDAPGENEFFYSSEKYRAFLDDIWNTPADCVRILFSYLGHYGVQVFFFLSGYAAVLNFSKNPPSWWSFVKRRLLSLYPAIFIAAIGMFIYYSYRYGFMQTVEDDAAHLVRQMFGISNFISKEVYKPIGPWWFIGVIVQFYLIAPLLFKIPLMNTAKRPLILAGIALSSILSEHFFGESLQRTFDCNFNHTILGHLDICALGMLAAHYKKLTIPLWVFALAALMFVMGNWSEALWIAAAFWMTILLVPLLRILADKLSKINIFDKTLLYLGQISIYIFLCNGYLRRPSLSYAEHDPLWWKSLYYCSKFVIFVIIWAAISYWIDQKISKTLAKRISAKSE